MFELTVYPAYALMVLLGFALVLLFPVTRGLTDNSDKKATGFYKVSHYLLPC